jgi:branched-chain amino acid transport system permease protein
MQRVLRQFILVLLGAVALFGVNFVLNLQQNGRPVFNPFVLRIVLLSGIFVTLAVSLNIVNGFTGQFSIGHAGFMAVGAYVGAAVATHIPSLQNSTLGQQLLLLLSCLAGGCAAAVFGYLVGAPSLRLRGDYLAIVTLGFGEIVRVVLQNTDKMPGLEFMGGAVGFGGIPQLTNFFWVFGLAAITILIARNLKRSIHGLAFLAVREDEIAADAMGVNTTRVKVTAFVLAAFLAGAAGSLFAMNEQFLLPKTFNFVYSINIVVMIVLGGLGSITGAVLTAIFFTAVPEFLRIANSGAMAQVYKDEYRLVAFALLLTLTMLLRPQGLFGTGELTLFRRRPEDTPPEPGSLPREETPTGPNPVLLCKAVTKQFGGLTAVSKLGVQLQRGELVGLIGPNGAGKTTAFNLLTGVYEPTSGSIEFEGEEISGERAYPAMQRTALLGLDALFAAFGGYLVGTVIYSMPLSVAPSEAFSIFGMALHAPLVWAFILVSAGYSLVTAPRRRRFRPGTKPYLCCQRGIARTFQNIRLFKDLTVLENVLVAAYGRRSTSLFSAMLQTNALFREDQAARARARQLLSEFNLADQEGELARNLPYGDQRRLEVVRALMTRPHLLLLDEPAAGMNPQEKVQLMSLIRRVRDEYNLTVLLIEHDMRLVMGICERIYVLDYGCIIAEGTPQEIRSNPKVIAAYLGEEFDDSRTGTTLGGAETA